jgi:hypothetical protein
MILTPQFSFSALEVSESPEFPATRYAMEN